MSQATSEVRKPSLKITMVLFALIFPWIYFFINMPLHSFASWWIWPAVFPFSMMGMILIFHLITKITGIKFSKETLVALFTVFFILQGQNYLTNGIPQWTIFPMWTFNSMIYYYGASVAPYQPYFVNMPSYLVPEPAAITALWNGGSFNMGSWIPSMLFWSIWSMTVYAGGFFWSYLIRKPLVDEEQLPFPFAQPTAYTIYAYDQEVGGKKLIFNLGTPEGKMIWAGFILGVILFLPSGLSNFLPAFPSSSYITTIDLAPLHNLMQSILPGSYFTGWFVLLDTLVLSFAPLDVLATATLTWVSFGVIYPTIGVRAGFLPYSPGYDVSLYSQSVGPIHLGWFWEIGIMIGIGVWMIWRYRKHILQVFTVGLGRKSEGETEDGGVPYRIAASGAVGTFVLTVLLFAAMGGNILMGIIGTLYFTIFMFGWIRLLAESYPTVDPDTSMYVPQFYSMGQALGQWGPPPDPNALNSVYAWGSIGGLMGLRQTGFGMHSQFMSYKISAMNNVEAKHVLYISVLTIISGAIAIQFLSPWWYTVKGGANTIGFVAYNIWAMDYGWNLVRGTPTPPYAPELAGDAIAGIIFVFIVYTLRARYAWFFINPVGVALSGSWGTWNMGFGSFIAFIIKVILIRFAGPKWIQSRYLPFLAGAFGGYSLVYYAAAITASLTRVPWF